MGDTDLQVPEVSSIRDALQFILGDGTHFKNERWCSDNPLLKLVNKGFPAILNGYLKEYQDRGALILCRGTSGSMGTWAKTMYVTVSRVKEKGKKAISPTQGVFPAYLINETCDEIYLVYMLGVGSKRDRELINQVGFFREKLDTRGYSMETREMKLGEDRHRYRLATICFKRYDAATMPAEEDLVADFRNIVDLHLKCMEETYPEWQPRASYY